MDCLDTYPSFTYKIKKYNLSPVNYEDARMQTDEVLLQEQFGPIIWSNFP